MSQPEYNEDAYEAGFLAQRSGCPREAGRPREWLEGWDDARYISEEDQGADI